MLRIYSEFASLREVLVHSGSNAIGISLETYQSMVPMHTLMKHPETREVRRDKLMANVAQLHLLLKSKGVALVYPETIDNALCQVFTRDPGFVVGDTLYLAAMKEDYRVCERSGLENFSSSVLPYTVDLERGQAKIEGGDVMIISPSLVLIGSGQTSNDFGFVSLRDEIMQKGFNHVVKIEHHALHLDCCVAPLPNGQVLVAEDMLPQASQEIVKSLFTKIVPLDKFEAEEHLAANMLWLNPLEVISNSMVPKTNAYLSSLGYTVHTLDFSGVTPMWGGIRCVTSPLHRLTEP